MSNLIEQLAQDIAREAIEYGLPQHRAEVLLQSARQKLRMAYAAGDSHGLLVAHPPESMGR